VYVHIDIRHMNMTVSTSAHPSVIVQRKNEDKFHYISSKGQMIGIFPDLKVQETQFKLQKNDRILIYTDGLLEAFNDKGEMFDEKNLEIALEANKNISVDGLVHLLAYRLKEWIGPLKDFEDDITMVVVDIL
nr:PP2C family protein-serine/threonine phosphatase [Leptospiraceae bacterium]